ncbi:hypothetical protein LCGC14_1229640 [marine sediment metagenome]|uniref:Uncharacterized protein n=1 Tax=marine sediment metagenome TaxID=412755 RepID=A0A0F9LD19_9ZZZZ
MASALGNHFRKSRLEKGLRIVELARQAGYRNVTKGCRRVEAFENTGRAKGDLISKLANALEIEDTVIAELLEADRRAWEEWADMKNQPQPYIVVRLLAAIYSELPLPDNVTTREDAEAFASQIAAKRRMQVCLVWNRKITVWFDRDGTCRGVRESTYDQDWRPRAWIV